MVAVSKKYPYEVTAEDRALFEAALRKWQEALNLSSWRVIFSSQKAARGATADVEISYTDRYAKVCLTDAMRSKPTPSELESYALHELWHVRLADLIHAVSEEADEKIVEAAEHDIIVLMVKRMMTENVDNA